MRIPPLILNPNLVQLDVQKLIHRLQRARYAQVILEFYRHFVVDERLEEATEPSQPECSRKMTND
jgi:hypothetical protein